MKLLVYGVFTLLFFQLANAGFVSSQARHVWPHNIVPYIISDNVPNQSRIYDAIDEINTRTNVTFVPYQKGDKDYIVIERPAQMNLCNSNVGRVGGKQVLNLGDICDTGNALHELGHAIGLAHEHQRPDRSYYIKIKEEHLNNPHVTNILTGPHYKTVGEYDMKSIMHYYLSYFTDKKDVVLLDNPMRTLAHLSDGDIETINTLYP